MNQPSTPSFTPLSKIGVREIIRQIKSGAPTNKPEKLVYGIGDDCSVDRTVGSDELKLTHSAILTEGVDFDLSFHALPYVAYKAISTVLSDFAAMNAKADAVQITLSVPNRISYEMLQEFYQGVYSACNEYELNLTGGDLAAGHAHLVIGVHATGTTKAEQITYRSGASIGDAICVTGDLGSAMAGLHVLLREKKHWESQGSPEILQNSLNLADYEYVVKRQLVPKARYDAVDAFHKHEITPTAMMDLSKGLLNDIVGLCDASKCGAYLYQSAIPIAIESRQVANEIQEDVDKFALYGGEDFELMFTMTEDQVNKFGKLFNDFAVVGRVTSEEEGLQLQKDDGDVVQFEQ